MGFSARDQGAESWPLAWKVLLQVADLGEQIQSVLSHLKDFFRR